jgi:ribosomal protein L31E
MDNDKESKVAAKGKMAVAPTDVMNVEKKLDKDKESGYTTNMEHCKQQKRTKEAEAALDALNKFISTILHADDEELKKLRREKSIRIYGRAAVKHKYACALLENYTKK